MSGNDTSQTEQTVRVPMKSLTSALTTSTITSGSSAVNGGDNVLTPMISQPISSMISPNNQLNLPIVSGLTVEVLTELDPPVPQSRQARSHKKM